MAGKTIFDAFGEAIADIRHKLVEEGWFGRETTDKDIGAREQAQGMGGGLGNQTYIAFGRYPEPDAPAPSRRDFQEYAGIVPEKDAPAPAYDRPVPERNAAAQDAGNTREDFQRYAGIEPDRNSPTQEAEPEHDHGMER